MIGDERKIKVIQWNGGNGNCSTVTTIGIVEQNNPLTELNRFNDGKSDPKGRLFSGTMWYDGELLKYRRGNFYKWTSMGMKCLKSNIGISNGMVWNPRKRKMYYVDSADFNVMEYDYNMRKGLPNFQSQREVFSIDELDSNGDQVVTDGMTIDVKGNIYVGLYRGYSFVKVNPSTKTILARLNFTSHLVTSVAFGGPDLDVLFVTSAKDTNQIGESGFLYKVTGLGKGLPMQKFKWKKSYF